MSDRIEGFVTASHTVLFEPTDDARCDACGAEIAPEPCPAGPCSMRSSDADRNAPADSDLEPFRVQGRGLLLWSRGDERRTSEPPLCDTCACAIGVTALHRWESEEDDGQ